MSQFLRQLRTAVLALVLATLVLGLAYPAAGLAVAGVLPHREVTVGRAFTAADEFHSRPSAGAYDPTASGGSNLGPNDAGLLTERAARRAAVAAAEGIDPADVAEDAISASGSGLDPDISPAYAAVQVPRVAAARGLSPDRVRALVAAHTSGRVLGFLGEPHVDVAGLNAALAGR